MAAQFQFCNVICTLQHIEKDSSTGGFLDFLRWGIERHFWKLSALNFYFFSLCAPSELIL